MWLTRFRHFWEGPLDALETEIARGKRGRKGEVTAVSRAGARGARTR